MLLRVALSLAAVSLVLGGCQPSSNSSASISVGVLAPADSSGSGTCTYASRPSQPTPSMGGTLDVALANRFVLDLAIGSSQTPAGDPAQARTEASRSAITGASVTLTDAAGNQLNAYTTTVTQTIDPASGDNPSYAITSVIAVDPGTVASFAGAAGAKPLPAGDAVVTASEEQLVISHVTVFGKTLGGESVQAAPIEFPVQLCLGCLETGSASGTCSPGGHG
jgi:hypothetical protein